MKLFDGGVSSNMIGDCGCRFRGSCKVWGALRAKLNRRGYIGRTFLGVWHFVVMG